jgi:hypothetical protein
MTKYWKLQAIDGEQPVVLYTATTDESIKSDLEAEPKGESLISFARMSRFHHEYSDETNHFDLAAGSFACYCDTIRHYSRVDSKVLETDGIPAELVPQGIGDHKLAGYALGTIGIYEHRPTE